MGSIGEILLVLVILVLVFGVGQLPQLGEAVGKMRLNYKRSLKGDDQIDITPADSSSKSSRTLDAGKPRRGAASVEDAELVE